MVVPAFRIFGGLSPLGPLLSLAIGLPVVLGAETVSVSSTAVQVAVNSAGPYTITVDDPAWTFGGSVGQPLENLSAAPGTDKVGAYREVSFDYTDAGFKHGAIRVYLDRKLVLFTEQYLTTANNGTAFPKLDTYPQTPYHLTYNGIFGIYDFNRFGADSPWLYFDSNANAFIISPASNFMVAETVRGAQGEITSGITSDVPILPAGFTHRTLLAVENSINKAFDSWGHALTDLQGKVRPANDADRSLAYLGYWTDNGAAYYYNSEPDLGYDGTLLAIRDEFARQGIPLGYIQLDSWFYPKGPLADWRNYQGGINRYVADSSLFPQTLKGFRQQLGIPLITHARWIDASSPYRQQYRISGGVSVDSAYWDTIGSYLQDAGAATYEQDWLGSQAQPICNLTDPEAFLSNMAGSLGKKGLTLQYCMALPHHFLQSSKYGNVTTIRTSQDRFGRDRWNDFLYGSRLASALGVWPWSDVFNSTEADNLLLSTLSAGPVGVGDGLGSLDRNNLLRAVRGDGIIVKPDVPIVPLDESFIRDARGANSPMVAATYTDFGAMKALYVFAYGRGGDTAVTFRPSSLGLAGTAYVHNYFTNCGSVVETGDTFADTMTNGGAYYIVVPVGDSGIAFLGDAGQFVSLGKKRIPLVVDSGAVQASVVFTGGEGSRVLHGYSPLPPVVTAIRGAAEPPVYDPATGLFTVVVSPDGDSTALVSIRQSLSQGRRRPQ
jgi:hypothetical protein